MPGEQGTAAETLAAASATTCPHGDAFCPCNDGDGTPCNYAYDPVSDTAGAPCRQPLCAACGRA